MKTGEFIRNNEKKIIKLLVDEFDGSVVSFQD